MPPCPACGLDNVGRDLCVHHHTVYGDDWAASNRIWCDFFHRGIVPERLAPADRDEDFLSYTDEVA